MNWQSWPEFLAMGGYALYVWGSYAVTVVVIAAEIAALILRRRGVIESLARYYAARGRNHEVEA